MDDNSLELCEKGCILARANNFIEAIGYFEKADILGNLRATMSLAVIYLEGQEGIDIDEKKGLKYLSKAIEAGDTYAIYYMANLRYEGRHVSQNYNQAFMGFCIAADQGYLPALLSLAECYELGKGTEIDLHEALSCYFDIIVDGENQDIIEIVAERLEKYREKLIFQYELAECYEYVSNDLINFDKEYYKKIVEYFSFNIESIISFKDENGETVLQYACSVDNGFLVRFLIDKGADINESDFLMQTPLMYSAITNSRYSASILIDSGAEIDKKNKNGETALSISINNNSIDVCHELLCANAKRDFLSDLGVSPLMSAVLNDNTDIIKLLIKKGCSIDFKDNDGNTALMIALYKKKIKSAQLLLKLGANIEIKNKNGETPLFCAVKGQSPYLIELLTKYKCNMDAINNMRETALIIAIRKNNFEVCRELIESGANVDFITPKGESIFQILCTSMEPKDLTLASVVCLTKKSKYYNLEKAIQLLKQAVALNYPQALLQLSHYYLNENKYIENFEKGIFCLLSALDIWDPKKTSRSAVYPSKWQMEAHSILYDYKGDSICYDVLQKYALQNNRVAQYYLYLFLDNNEIKAKYLLEAANNGFKNAQYELGICYHTGTCGFLKNIDKAKYYLEKAVEQDHINSKIYLKTI